MVSSSLSSPTPMESSFPSVVFDHTYSKNNMTFDIPSSPANSSVSEATTFDRPSDSPLQSVNQTDASSNAFDFDDSNNLESDMLCDLDLDDLDFSLSDFDMDTESNNNNNSFQDFVDSTLSLSTSADVTVASGCARSLAASLGRQDTVCLSSSCNTSSMVDNARSSSTESRLSSTFPPESSIHNTIPTKKFSCFESDSDGNAVCVYSSCHRDLTTLSSSTSGAKLKPGDYLPPLYVDTHSYGHTNCSNYSQLQFPGEPNKEENKRQLIDSFVGNTFSSPSTLASSSLPSAAAETTIATATAMCEDSSCVLTPLSLPDFCQSDNQKSDQREEEQIEQLTDSYFAETPRSQFEDSIDDLDLELISDFEKYLTEASLDLRALTSTSPKKSESLSFTHSPIRPQSNGDSQTKAQRNVQVKEGKYSVTDILPVSGLKLSILDDYSSKHELTSWLDGYAHDAITTPPLSPGLSPGWREIADDQMGMERNLKQDTNILDLFSDDNAHAFLDDDSAICQMHVSQFM